MKIFHVYMMLMMAFASLIGCTKDVNAQKFFSENAFQKPRIMNMTDLGIDPDDEQSMVRFIVQCIE